MKKIILIILVIIIAIVSVIWIFSYHNTKKNNDIKTIKIKNVKEIIYGKIQEIKNKELFGEYYEVAYQKLQTLTLEEKIGQLMLARIPDYNEIEDIKKYNLGGYILFGKDTKYETKESLKEKIDSYQKASKIPMIIAVDEEGGTVVRISNNPNLRSSIFLSPGQLYKKGGLELIEENTKEMSELLDSLGINTDLAPVADISTSPEDFIYNRSLRARC